MPCLEPSSIPDIPPSPPKPQIASDCIWSDPALEDMEGRELDELGFGESLRGGGAVCFGNRAVDNFLAANNFSYIIRAHEAHAEGVGLSKGARVFTVFSTSKDHGQGTGAVAGCVLIDPDAIRVINRSAKYKNKCVRLASLALGFLGLLLLRPAVQGIHAYINKSTCIDPQPPRP